MDEMLMAPLVIPNIEAKQSGGSLELCISRV